MQTIVLTDGGILLYDEGFLPSDLADRYIVDLRDNCGWEQKPGIFGHKQPRLTASYGDPGVTYRYSLVAFSTTGYKREGMVDGQSKDDESEQVQAEKPSLVSGGLLRMISPVSDTFK